MIFDAGTLFKCNKAAVCENHFVKERHQCDAWLEKGLRARTVSARRDFAMDKKCYADTMKTRWRCGAQLR